MFRVAAQNRVFQDVVNQIQDAIIDGKLGIGDTLPPERDLKEMFNTSRGTLREALRVLEERGLIHIKLGVHGGAIVKGVNSDQARSSLARMVRSRQIDLNHLSEFREGVEGNVASLAAQRASDEDKKKLLTMAEEAKGYVFRQEPDRDAFIEVDKRFHQELAVISQNPVYIFVLETVHDNIHRYYDRYLSMEKGELEENCRDLQDIAHAVANRRSDEARLLAQSHVLRFCKRMAKRQNINRVDKNSN
ncbi:MAG: FadR family transcriptional regulator [Desulfobacteraceae bacterium]|nr:FadR family transcriptional regulator [Desulfobacteraceae bacterium]